MHLTVNYIVIKDLIKEPLLIVSFAFSVFFVFVLVMVISWVLDLGQAKQMNMDLDNYKKRILE